MLYSCSVSSFSHYQPASASWRTLLYVEEMMRRRFAAGEGSWSWMNVLVNTFAERAHTEGGYVKSARGAILQEASGDLAGTCLPSRLSRVRVPSPAFSIFELVHVTGFFFFSINIYSSMKNRESPGLLAGTLPTSLLPQKSGCADCSRALLSGIPSGQHVLPVMRSVSTSPERHG